MATIATQPPEHSLRDEPGDSPSLRDFTMPAGDGPWSTCPRSDPLGRKAIRFLSNPSFRRLASIFEGAWSPPADALPTRNAPLKDSGAFRASVEPDDRRLGIIAKSERQYALSDWTVIRTNDVPVIGLQKPIEGLTILHLTDIHFLKNNKVALSEMNKVAQALEHGKIRADIVVVTGDIITHAPDDLMNEELRVLRRIADCCSLRYFVLGNHDYHWKRPDLVRRALEWAGYSDLTCQHDRISIDGASVAIHGLDDAYFGRNGMPPLLRAKDCNIILTHNLDALHGAFPRAIDVVLAGHTHWGETPFVPGTWLMKQWGYCDNINRHTKGWQVLDSRALAYVGRGLAAYYVKNPLLWHQPGFAIHRLVGIPSKRPADRFVTAVKPALAQVGSTGDLETPIESRF